MQASATRHLMVPRRPSFEATGRLLLLALAMDRPEGHPDCVAATARILGVSGEALRGWRDGLLADALLARVDGFLRPGPAMAGWTARARGDLEARGLRWRFDPLPRRAVGRLSPAGMHAAALVYADAIGWETSRRFVRSDEERAQLAGTSRPTVRTARRQLERLGLIEVERIRRGRASLTRAALTGDRRATHGAPMAEAKAAVLAAAGQRGRSTVQPRRTGSAAVPQRATPPTGLPVTPSTGLPPTISTLRVRPPSGAAAPPARGRQPLRSQDGARAEQARKRVEDFLRDPGKVARFLAMRRNAEQQARELLALAGFGDGSRRLLREWPKMLASRWHADAPGMLLAVIADIAQVQGRNRAACIGAVLRCRLPRMLAGKPEDALSDANKGATIGQMLEHWRRHG